MRISKYLSDIGIASRRGAEQMILDGRITLNGEIVKTPVTFVSKDDKVLLDGKRITNHESRATIYLFHKPTGCITSAHDPEGRRTIYDILPKEYQNLKYIGRLDYNTSGLLLMTNDGTLAHEMTMPGAGVERVYMAKVGGAMTMDDDMMNRILKPVRKGIKIKGIIYRPMKVERLSGSDLKITITEGKKNEIRIVFEHIGLPIRKLHRVSYGKYELGPLAAGKIRPA